ncbi:ribosome recycling factor family protein [Thalassotalea nanhaiensis]|uniref:Ribosome recycling factor family protein n=1 Tax=Thalassotalea nanhaiensis TaxID=3065648 RepID=A0ABY9TFK4_9GAMM|nr:ribosome recycling factor family protein [Colwelliaceae bacterium SQ345]
MPAVHHILLPSFLRRAMRAFELKALVRQSGCELNRIGRSRNWRLTADREQMTKIIELVRNSEEETWQWLVKLIEKERGSFTHTEILNLVKRNPGISVTELVVLANCTIAEARTAIDEFEWSEE